MPTLTPNLYYSRAASARRRGVIPSHADVSRAKLGTTTRVMADRIVATITRATPSQYSDGLEWYANARALAAELMAIRPDWTLEKSCAVISALSPQCRWNLNARQARAAAQGAELPRPCLPDNRARVARVMASDNPADEFDPVDAPKIFRFARNIAGDDSAVTVDVWAARVALGLGRKGKPDKLLGRVGAYAAIEHSYRLAAARLGLTPSAAQAIAWLVISGN